MDLQRRCQVFRHIALNREQVLHLAIVGFTPETPPGLRIIQNRDDFYPVVQSLDAAFKEGLYAELLAYLLQRLACASGHRFVWQNRVARNNPEIGNAGELENDFVSEAVAQILILFVISDVIERQHGHGLLINRRRRQGRSIKVEIGPQCGRYQESAPSDEVTLPWRESFSFVR